jgi:hypothetical protein
MRWVLIILGVLIAGAALLFWIWLNGMASAWNTSNSGMSIVWFDEEAAMLFWAPFLLGVGLAVLGWRRR